MHKGLAWLVAVAVVSGCSPHPVVNTGETWVPTATGVSAPSGPASNANLVNAFDYYAQSNGQPGYFFTTPSGKWRCAIVPHTMAGCQSAQSRLAIPGEPSTVTDAQGQTAAPNAIVVDTEGDPHFASLAAGTLSVAGSPAKTLQLNKILAAAGFRCNVSNAGVACLSEPSGNGFTFSGDGYTPSYTDVPG